MSKSYNMQIQERIDSILSQLEMLDRVCYRPVIFTDVTGKTTTVGREWSSDLAENSHNHLVEMLAYFVNAQREALEITIKENTQNGTKL